MNWTWIGLRQLEVTIINYVQVKLNFFGPLFISSCYLGDPRYPYTVIFPIGLSLVSHRFAFMILWSVLLSEWLNAIFKWFLADDRPYWWVKEMTMDVKLKQFDITCETGPGNPSGHVMVTSCVWIVILLQLIQFKVIKRRSTIVWCLVAYSVCLFTIGLGRMYISAHFPDQCILGLIAGLTLGYAIRSTNLQAIRLKTYVVLFAILVVGAYLSQFLADLIRHNEANWSLILAKKWCFDPKYAKADTSPLFGVWRTGGTLLGIGLSYNVVSICLRKVGLQIIESKDIQLLFRFVNCAVSLSLLLLLDQLKWIAQPEKSLSIYYAVTLVRYTLSPIIGYCSIVLLNNIFYKLTRTYNTL